MDDIREKLIDYKEKKLDCGLTVFYSEQLDFPANYGEMVLIVKVGGVDEKEREFEFSHFLEHLLLRAAEEKFPETNFYGGHETFFDRTVFPFTVNTEAEISTVIEVLATIATKTTIEDRHIALEREVITIENTGILRLRDHWLISAIESMMYERADIKHHFSDIESFQYRLSSITAEELNAFYKNWYKLGNMALICVGNFQFEEILSKAEMHFIGDKEGSVRQLPVGNYEMKFIQNRFMETGVFLIDRRPRYMIKDNKDLIQRWETKIAMEVFNELAEYRAMVFGQCLDIETDLVYIFGCDSWSTDTPTNIEQLTFFFDKVRCILQLKLPQDLLKSARERMFIEIDSLTRKYYSSNFSFRCSVMKDNLKDKFLYGDALFQPKYKLGIARQWIDSGSSSFSLLPDSHIYIISNSLELSKKDMLYAMNMSSREELEEPRSTTKEIANDLLLLCNNESFDTRINYSIGHGLTEWRLPNKMKVAYYRSEYLDQWEIVGFAYGGLSESDSSSLLSHYYARHVASVFGIIGLYGEYKGCDGVEASLKIGQYLREFEVSFKRFQLEIVLQKIYSLFVTNDVPEFFEGLIDRVQKYIDDGKVLGYDHILEIAKGDGKLSKLLKASSGCEADNIDMLKACIYHNECFKDPSDFTLILIGDLDASDIESQIMKYLGSIPKNHRSIFFPRNQLKLTKFKLKFPQQIQRVTLRYPRPAILSKFFISVPLSLNDRYLENDKILIKRLRTMMSDRLLHHLRFVLGKPYDIEDSVEYDGHLYCSPKNRNAIMTFHFKFIDRTSDWHLVDEALKVLEEFREHGPLESQFRHIRADHDMKSKLMEAYHYSTCTSKGNVEMSYKEQEVMEIKMRYMGIDEWRYAIKRIFPHSFIKRHVAVALRPPSPT